MGEMGGGGGRRERRTHKHTALNVFFETLVPAMWFYKPTDVLFKVKRV